MNFCLKQYSSHSILYGSVNLLYSSPDHNLSLHPFLLQAPRELKRLVCALSQPLTFPLLSQNQLFQYHHLWQLIFRPRIAILSFVGGAAVLIGTDFIARQLSFPNVFAFAFEPGNSLRPIRAAIPYLVAIASYLLINYSKNGLRRNILAGLLIGATLLFSSRQNSHLILRKPYLGLPHVRYVNGCLLL